MRLPQFYVDDLIKTALREDINYIDITTDLMIPEDARGQARFIAKENGVLCGLDVALRVFELLDGSFKAEVYKKDGDMVNPGDLIAEMTGKIRGLLKGERTALPAPAQGRDPDPSLC